MSIVRNMIGTAFPGSGTNQMEQMQREMIQQQEQQQMQQMQTQMQMSEINSEAAQASTVLNGMTEATGQRMDASNKDMQMTAQAGKAFSAS